MSDNLYQNKDFKDKLRLYEDSQKNGCPVFLEPDDLTDIAEYYFYHGRANEALTTIRYAIKTFPGALHPLAFMARYAILVKGNAQEAFDYASQIANKDDLDYYYTIAEIFIADDRTKEAQEYLLKQEGCIDEDDQEDFYLDAATLFADYSCLEEALFWLDKSSDTTSPDYIELQGRIAMMQGDYEKSERIFNKLLDEDPYASDYWNQLASSQFLNDNMQGSIESSNFSLAIDPDDFDAVLNKANGLFQIGNYDEALKYYKRFKHLQPLNEAGDMGIATVYIATDHKTAALEHLEKAEKLCNIHSVNKLEILRQKFNVLTTIKNYAAANLCIDAMEKTKGCDLMSTHVMRGFLALKQEEPQVAKTWFDQALGFASKDDLQAKLLIAYSAYESGYIHMARKVFSQVVDRVETGSWSGGWAFMALCDNDLGDRKAFLNDLQKAITKDPDIAASFLSHLFPAGLNIRDYYDYALKHSTMGSTPYDNIKDNRKP